jgi:hypothetical protein
VLRSKSTAAPDPLLAWSSWVPTTARSPESETDLPRESFCARSSARRFATWAQTPPGPRSKIRAEPVFCPCMLSS